MHRSFVVALATGFALIAGVGAGADARAQDDKPTSPPPQQEPPAKKPADPA
jgi:hypothetical protein